MSELKILTDGVYESIRTDRTKLSKMMRIGYSRHRGVGIENSIYGLIKAKEQGYDYVEVDVRKTSDNELVCCHNDSVGGYTISETTASVITEVVIGKQLGIGLVKVPTFDQFVKTAYLIGMNLVIDTKTGSESEIAAIVHKYNMQDNVIYLAYSLESMTVYAENYRQAHIHYLSTSGASIPSDVSGFVALKAKCDHIGFNVNGTRNADLVQSNVIANGFELSYWNVTASNYAALAATYPMFMTTDMKMDAIKAAENTFLASAELW